MQCTSFLPECYSNRDLNVGPTGGTWTVYNSERISQSGRSRNVFLPPTEDHFLVYKEVLRQTILKHESIFRDQVHELHRLYRRQRELMDEIKRRELSTQSFQLQISHCNSFLPKISSDSSLRMWEIPSLPWVNPSGSGLPIPSTENFPSTSSFFSCKTTQASPDIAPTEDNLKDCKMSLSKCEKPKRKMLDLELPADEYIDSEEENRFEEEKVSNVLEVSKKSDLELLGHDGPIFQVSSSPNAFSRRRNDFAGLNEPPVWHKGDAVVSNSVSSLGKDTHHEMESSNSGFEDFSKEIVSCIVTRRALESCLKRHPEQKQQENLPGNDEIGQSASNLNSPPQVSSSGKLSMPCEQLKLELPAKFSTFNLLDKRDKKLQNQGTNSVRDVSDHRRLASSCLPTSYQLVPRANSESSSVSSQRKPTRKIMLNPIAVQALPCFNIAVPSSKGTKSSPKIPPVNGKRNVISTKAVDLNMPPSPSFLMDSEVSQENDGTEDGVTKHEDSSHKDLVVSQDLPNSVCDGKPKRFKTNDFVGNEKILGSFNFEKSRISTNQVVALASSSDSNPDATEDEHIKNNRSADVSLDMIVDGMISDVGNQIDLNCCINEDESSPPVKPVAVVDLEAPVSPENKECSPPRGESEENQLKTAPIDLPKQEDSDRENELVRMAAEAIVLISTPGVQKLGSENIVYETSDAAPTKSLNWFAGIVASVADDDLENFVGNKPELSSDGSDYFEGMTLELTEMVDECWCKSNGQKVEETSKFLSPSQPRRGRALRGRQRKHFQMEVLPSLASLSRHEVTEDLQIIGGLMEAAGLPVETNLGRRNVGRNACSRARRRSSNISSCLGMETTVCSPVKKRKSENDFVLGEKGLKGWGKMNRRRRGPRVRACNLSVLFS